MEISVPNRKLRKSLDDPQLRQRRYGAEMAAKLRSVLARLDAAESLGVFWPPMSGPERCHELSGDLAGRFSIDLKHPYRLLFTAEDGPTKEDEPDESKRWSQITKIEIEAIEDTHG